MMPMLGTLRSYKHSKKEITLEVGGWVGPGLTRKKKRIGQSFQNSPIPVLILWGSAPCIFCL